MSRWNPTRPRRIAAAAVLVALTVAGSVSGSVAASASTAHRQPPVKAGDSYLALGDSVTFGYREAANLPTPDYTKATNFMGYPEYIGQALDLKVANTSCPGETSSSFIAANVTSNGCENSPTGPVGYRTAYPLHTKYAGTQLTAAIKYLKRNPDTRLVSLMIGANDGFLCQETTADQCASELPGVLKQIRANVATILSGVRDQARYRGQIVIVNYYSLDYRSAAQNTSTAQLNKAMDAAAKPYDVAVADGNGVFEKAAEQAGGDTCAAGLLTTLTTGGCGVHPSVGGQALLATAVERVLRH
jgi:lysophospholipase L1-like esterase